MSLAIAFKGPEGIVLAADSRVTLNAVVIGPNQQQAILPATFDNASKLLHLPSQPHIGAITYGLGALGTQHDVRTAHSLLPEFAAELETQLREHGSEDDDTDQPKISVREFAVRLGDFYKKQYDERMAGTAAGPDMTFLVGGFDTGEAYGRLYEVGVPSSPVPKEWHAGSSFGAVWGGQHDIVDRVLNGFDQNLLMALKAHLELTDDQMQGLIKYLGPRTGIKIPYQFLALQDCIDLLTLMIRTTIDLQNWIVDVRGVGGAIDVATITRTDGFNPV